jgi:hypothetical protein
LYYIISNFVPHKVAKRRHLTKDRYCHLLVAQEVFWFAKMVEEAEGQIDHFSAARGDLRSPAKPSEIVSDIAVVLLDPEGQVLAGEELRLGDAAVVAVPVVGQKDPAFDADFLEELLAGRIVTLTQNPG